MRKYLSYLLLIIISLSSLILSFECSTLKLDNISSERALTTLKALGYNTVEHTNVYMDDIKLTIIILSNLCSLIDAELIPINVISAK